MAINLLSELKPGTRNYTVQLYVSRLWQHRGGTDDGPIRHTDIVFLDTQGDHMYGEIAETLVDQFIGKIEEGKVYLVKSFLVGTEKRNYRPVEGGFIIRFGRYTTLQEVDGHLMDYPLCTYALTPLDQLPAPVDHPVYFIDVIGVITGVSAISQYHSATRTTPSTKRVIYLSDLSGFQVNVILWGERALSFDGEGVLKTAQTNPVVAIFVGCIVKPFEGRRSLSGGAPCRWYIDEDLPEINEICAKLKGKLPAVKGITLPGQSAAEISAQVDLETKTVEELVNLHVWNNQQTRFFCTVTITKMSPGQRWWFHACSTCNHGTVPFGAAYKCPKEGCGGMGGTARFRLCYLASDGTEEFELVFFEKAGKELVGKTALTLLRNRAPRGMTVDEAIQFGCTDQTIPREITAIVSRKFRLVVSVTSRSLDPDAPKKPAYQVHRIDAQFGAHGHGSALRRRPGLALASSSGSSGGGLSLAGEALADNLIAGQVTSANAPADLSVVPSSVVTAGSLVASETTPPLTPPSVAKPTEASGGKDVFNSSVKRALFEELSPPPEAKGQDDSTAQTEIGLALVGDATPPPAPSTAASEEKTNNSRKPGSGKNKVEPHSKKKRT